MRQELWKETIEALTHEPDVTKGNRSLLWNLGWAYYKSGQFEMGAGVFRQALSVAATDFLGRWALGLCLMELEQHEASEHELLLALALHDGHLVRIALALLYLRTDRKDLAEAIHREGIRIRPDRRERLEALADFLSDVGREEESQAVMRQAEALPTREQRKPAEKASAIKP